MATGRVKWFNEKKGYGFITQDDGKDLFVHYKDIEGSGYKKLVEDDVVEFEIAQAEKGPKATKVRVVEP